MKGHDDVLHSAAPTPLTIPESRAILAADRARSIAQVHVDHGQLSPIFDDDETEAAWRRLVASARSRVTLWTENETGPEERR